MQNVIITPGTFIDGYYTTEYGDPIAIQKTVKIQYQELLNTFMNKRLENATEDRISIAQAELLEQIKRKALSQDYNGILGFKYDYMSFSPATEQKTRLLLEYYVILVAVQGTPVKLVKENK